MMAEQVKNKLQTCRLRKHMLLQLIISITVNGGGREGALGLWS
jgi:hypothetical protein